MNADPPKMRVGLVGAGRMGLPIARHLMAANYDLTVFDALVDARDAAAALGVATCDALSGLAAAEAVLVLVPTDDDLRAICTGADGLAAALGATSVIVVCGSHLPETVRQVSQDAARRGVSVLDAPLTRGVRGAEAGTLTVLAGGEAAVLERVRPVLECFAIAVHHLGPVGTGQVAKSVNNILLWANLAAVQEALSLGVRLGVPAERMREALLDGSADSWVLRELQQIQPTWPVKDLHNSLQMASGVGAELPLTECVAAGAGALSADAIERLLAG